MSGKLTHLVVVVLAVTITGTSLRAAVDPNLVGWWKFDDGAGTVAADSSGHDLHGTLLNNPVWRADGQRNGCLFFNGSNAYVRVADHALLNPGTGSFTVLHWANVDVTAGTAGSTNWDLAVAKRQATANGYYVGADRNNGGGAGKTGYRFMLGDTAATRKDTAYVPVPLGEWVFVAAVLDRAQNAQKISLDGGQTWATTTPPPGPIAPARDLGLGWDIGENNYWFRGRIDDVALFNRALSAAQIGRIMQKGMTPELAQAPRPGTGVADLPLDVTLSWSPGLYAATHDVYVGTSLADVSAASRTNPLGVLVGEGQTGTTYDLSRLAFGQTYYWRVDEVNKAPDNTIFKGDIWSFTVESYGNPIKPMAATASSSQSDMGPEKTMDGSGLDKNGLHGTEPTSMWMSAGVQPNWIQYEFDKVYPLHQLMVWNSNQLIEGLLGFGAKKVTVETSTDGTTWKALAEVPEFAKAPGAPGYAANTTVNFGGVEAKFVKLTIHANQSGMAPATGLAEVRFFYVPVWARQPSLVSGAKNVMPPLTLGWRPGRQAARHEVYLSTDRQAVLAGTAPMVAATKPSFDPAALALGQTYYWKVNEVNEAAAVKVWDGDLWSFSMSESIVVDDFEAYTATEGSQIFQIWIDGWENKTGSQVGHIDAPFVERTIIRGGGQSMPLTYTNAAAPFYSEAQRTFDTAQDWTQYGVKTLILYFRGTTGNDGKLYLKINNTKVAYPGAATDLAREVWQAWNIDLATVGGNLSSVKTLTIGVEGSNAKGILYFDDFVLTTEPDAPGLVAHYKLDGNTDDSSAHGYHGVIVGAPTFVSGMRGQALEFDGTDDHVRIAHRDRLNPGAGSFTFTFWANVDPVPGTSGTTNWDLAVAKRDNGNTGYYVGADRGQGDAKQTGYKFMLGNTAAVRVDTPWVLVPMGEWAFVAAVLDRENNAHKISIDGGKTWASAKPPVGRIAPAIDLAIGWDIGPNNYWFHGKIDDVRLYNYALSNQEIASLAAGQ